MSHFSIEYRARKNFLSYVFLLYRKYITYAEVECKGPGANMSKRVQWEKTLTAEQQNKFVDQKLFLNQDGWIEEQRLHL